MLIIEQYSNGQRMVVLKKDWNPSMLSKGYVPKRKNYVEGQHMERLQRALLATQPNPRKQNASR